MKTSDESKTASALPVLLCHGATHKFRVYGETNDSWVNQQLSANSTPGKPPLLATLDPAVGKLNRLSEKNGAEWTITLPPDGIDTKTSLTLTSEFTAPTYSIDFSTGHHRPKFSEIKQPTQPIVLNEDTAVLSAKVTSYYIAEKNLEGIEVTFMVEGKTFTKYTGADGRFDYEFKPKSIGEPEISMSMWSPYDNDHIQHTFNVKVIATSQWASDLEFLWNDVPYEIGKGIVARPGNNQKIQIKPKNSNLIGSWIYADRPNMPLNESDRPLKDPKVLGESGIEWGVHVNDSFEESYLHWSCSPPNIRRYIPIRFFGSKLSYGGIFTLDGALVTSGTPINVLRDTVHKLEFIPSGNNTLVGLEFELELTEPTKGLKFSPDGGQKRRMSVEGLEWSVDTRDSTPPFLYSFYLVCSDPTIKEWYQLKLYP